MVAMFFSAFNQTIIGVAMPRIIAKLGGIDYYTWVITIYLLTMAVATILVGKLSDIYGRKPFLLLGISLFTIGALLSGFANTIFWLICFRAITGFGAGIIYRVYCRRRLIFTAGTCTMDRIDEWGIRHLQCTWPSHGRVYCGSSRLRWVFWVFLPLGVVAFFMILSLFPKVPRREGESIDYFGSIFITITVVALLLAFSFAGDGPDKFAWTSWQIVGLFGLTLVGLLAFIITESKVKTPLLPLSLFKNSIVTFSNIAGFLLGAGMMGVMIYAPFFIQGVKGISPSGSGYIMMPMSLVMVFATAYAGQYMTKTGKYKGLAIVGLCIMTIGVGLLYLIHINTPIFVLIAYLCIVGIGLGLSMPVFSLTVQNAVPLSQLGVATASSQLFRSLGNTLGIGILGSIMSSRMATKMSAMFADSSYVGQSSPTDRANQIGELMNPQILLDQPQLEETLSNLPADVRPIAEQLVANVREVFSDALTTVFLAGAVIMVIAIVVAVFIKAIPLVSAQDKMKPAKETH